MPVAQLQPKDYVRQVPANSTRYSESDALGYTRWLATHHYENFHVVSFLLPRHLHQHFYNVYSFCRWADDLGDEIGDPHESLRLLAWWRGELQAMYAGQPSHPVFVAMKNTVERFGIPIEPFDNLTSLALKAQVVGNDLPSEVYDVFNPVVLPPLVGAGVVIAVLGGLVPGRWASRLRVADALHAE